MSKRNFALLIIALVIATVAATLFLYSGVNTNETGESGEGTNFISRFNPFGGSKPPEEQPTDTPTDVSSVAPEGETEEVKLVKVSSMPVAGFGVYMKERFKDVPVVAPATAPSTPYNFGTTTLKSGSTGEAVKELERFLNNTLNLSLELDGVFDAEVTGAIKQWQSNNGLVADGIVGAKTKAAMYASVNQSAQTKEPVAPPTEFVPALRYVARATGNIYQTFADKIEERRFSTTVIPKIYEAYFGNQGETVIMRYLKSDERTIQTFVGNLPKERLGEDTSQNNEVQGSFLPENVSDLSLAPDASKIFYIFNIGENAIGTTLNLSDNKKNQIFDSPYTEWLSWWPRSSMITLTTKPSAGVRGYMYTVDPNTRSLSKVLGDISGLTTLTSPDGKLVLYGSSDLSLYIYHTDTRVVSTVGIRTLPEKCIWGSESAIIYCAVPTPISPGQYPDSWYQGEVSFSDQIWKIEAGSGVASMISDPAIVIGGQDVDGTKLALDESGNYLFFVNKKDSFLWKLDLK